MEEKETASERKAFHRELLEQVQTLLTTGFGLVAALAWNEAIQAFVSEYIEPTIPGSGLISKFVYAILITVFIVFITYELSQISARFRRK